MQTFDKARYLDEMWMLMADACTRFHTACGDVEVYTIFIWTDADAVVSAVNFDTRENSVAKLVVRSTHFGKDMEGRNYNPADFAFTQFAVRQHESFSTLWKEKSQGSCWKALEPALAAAVEASLPMFKQLHLNPNCELGVNSRRDWFDRTWLLSANE